MVDHWSTATQRLVASLERAKISFVPIVIQYRGDLNTEILNPFLFFTGHYRERGDALFFNELQVPDLYEIRHIDSGTAHVLDGDRKVGEITYFPESQRLIRQVDWFDYSGHKIYSDKYSMQGFKYCYSIYSNNKEKKQIFIDSDENEVISWDLESKQITLNYKEQRYGLRNLKDFVSFFLKWLEDKERLFPIEELYVNSLSTSLAVAGEKKAIPTTLFWQEQLHDEIPGNLRRQLENPLALRRVIFESEQQKERLEYLFPEPQHITYHYLGAIERFSRRHTFSKKAFTLTKSDEIFYLEELAQMYPQLHWTIAAPTKVSDKLTKIGTDHQNIHICPQVTSEQIEELLLKHDWYFDFNKGPEVANIINKAYLQNYLIFTKKELSKNFRYGIEVDDAGVWQEVIGECLNNRSKELELLNELHKKNGLPGTSKMYRKLLNQTHEDKI